MGVVRRNAKWLLAAAVLAAGVGVGGLSASQLLRAGEQKHGEGKGGKGGRDAGVGTVQQLVPAGQTSVGQTVKSGEKNLSYLVLQDKDKKTCGYIFTNEALGSKIKGYDGPITLAVRTDAAGKAEDLVLLKHTETPRYVMKVMAQKAKFLGKSIIPAAKPKADVVTGATYTSEAISESLYEIGAAYAAVLKPPAKP